MAINRKNSIKILTNSRYLDAQSQPDSERYVFGYTITIKNDGSVPAKLLSRHWLITDANGKVQEVHGEGVVGEKPHIRPGELFRYTSAAVLETPVGIMKGDYQMLSDEGTYFDADIPQFTLSVPRVLH